MFSNLFIVVFCIHYWSRSVIIGTPRVIAPKGKLPLWETITYYQVLMLLKKVYKYAYDLSLYTFITYVDCVLVLHCEMRST